jgi:hypothetical protein
MKYKVGQHDNCPKCGSLKAKIIWISEDAKTLVCSVQDRDIITKKRCDIGRRREMNVDGCTARKLVGSF